VREAIGGALAMGAQAEYAVARDPRSIENCIQTDEGFSITVALSTYKCRRGHRLVSSFLWHTLSFVTSNRAKQ